MSGSYQSIPTNVVYTSGDQNVYGIKNFGNTTASTSTTTGGTTFAGGIGIAGSINSGTSSSNQTLNGNITLGTNSTNLLYVRGNITAGSGSSNNILNGDNVIGSGSSNNHQINGNTTIGNSSSASHQVNGSLAITKPITTAGRKSAITTKSANYTTVATDEFILVNAASGAITITLLSASSAGDGATITVQKIDASLNAVTISSVLTGGTLMGQYASANFVSNGTSWYKY